jgi:hypothetical protein
MAVDSGTLRREVRRLYALGLSKTRITDFLGIPEEEITKIIGSSKKPTFEKHQRNEKLMAEQIRLTKKNLIGFKVPRSIKNTATQIVAYEKIKTVEKTKAQPYQRRNRIREVTNQYGKKTVEDMTSKILKAQNEMNKIRFRKAQLPKPDEIQPTKKPRKFYKRKSTKSTIIDDVSTIIGNPRFEYPSTYTEDEIEYLNKHGGDVIWRNKKGYQILISGALIDAHRKYTLVDINLYTTENLSIDEIFAYINSMGYNIQRTREMQNSNQDRVNITVVSGNEYVKYNTEITSDWKSTLSNALNQYSFRRPKSGSYWRQYKKLKGKSVSNPDYKKMFDERGVL